MRFHFDRKQKREGEARKPTRFLVLRRKWLTLAAAGLAVIAVFAAVNYPAAVSAAASTRQLPIYCVQRDQKVCSISFDAAWGADNTQKILDVLKAREVPAAFFVVGNYLQTAPELVQRMVDEGHLVGNHTEHHWDMSRIADRETFRKELETVEEQYRELTGQEMEKFYRPPQGVYSEENLRMAKELGYKTVFWSLAYVDWYQDDQPTAEQAFSKLIPRIHPGAVVLLHSTSQTNAAILDELIGKWEALGYRFGRLEELFD